ncbi:hypothetical protein BD324DRAFT_574984 [Kockovaella imperatae]|uniref:Mad3/BUB1 homology region 1-domain-containing protein n=1 Tax=Kockovaella imperatae TaxID=4999 RepID=A0A1Y1URA8_9TREE|nr:hypothetical protein BD324DRAFT_574984 [Kockovaella imperatae]ORX40462.1 hypothetical protein BD324DRAFT_574984 [Kockovaella imperatae]
MDVLTTPRPAAGSEELPMTTPTTDFSVIEAQKENIRPHVSGRSAATLSNLFAKSSESDRIVQEGHERHQKAIEEAERRDKEGEEMEEGIVDVLDAYNRYILFTVQHHPSAASHLLPLLESTTRRFVNDGRYAQDARHLKLWVMYARHVERREEVWAFLESKDVGTKHAVFYEEWAMALEGLGRKKKSDDIYRLGIHRKAAPVDRLKNRHQAFLARIMAPPSGVVPDDEPERSTRAVLGQTETGPSLISGAVQLAPSTRLSRAPNGHKMEIFTDSGASGDDGERGEWADLGTRDDRRKENTVEATPWKGETLPQKRAAQRTPKLEVFKDSLDNDAVRSADEVFSRQRASQSEAEMLKANPLRFHDTSAVSTAIPSLPAPPSACKAPRARVESSTFVMMPWKRPSDGPEIKDAKGKTERRMFPWDAVYKGGEEWCFEEVRARQRGILGKEYRKDVQEWEMQWHEPGASTPKAKAPPRKPPSPTFNTKLANEEVARMFDQTIHGGKMRDPDSDSDETSDDEDDVAPVFIAPTPNPATMLSPGSGMVPPTPTPAQGSLLQHRPAQSMMVFADENAGLRSASKPKFNIFSDTPAQTPLAAKPRAFGVYQEEPSLPMTATPAVRPRIASNPFATPAPEAVRPVEAPAEPVISDVIEEAKEEEAYVEEHQDLNDQYEPVPFNNERDFKKRLSTISERTMEYTQMTDGRGSSSVTRRTSAASSLADEAFSAGDISRRGLNVVAEEDESRGGRTSDASSAVSPQNQSGSMGTGFHLPEGFTIHGQADNLAHTLVVTEVYDTMHTAREGSPDTGDFVTAKQALPNPCNPSDPDILTSLFADMDLGSLGGYLFQHEDGSRRMDGLVKFAKSKGRRNSTSASASRSSLAPEECFHLDLSGKPYEVLDKIGEGGFGAVFLAADVEARDAQDEADSDDEDGEEDCLVAIKVERPSALWEGVVLDRIHQRLEPAARPSIVQPRAVYAFTDESFLVMDFASQGTLLDAVNKASSMGIAPLVPGGPSAFDELLAIFFTIELLRTVEDLHNAKFIHGDLKIDNCLIRLSEVPNAEWSAQYLRTGAEGWSDKGIKLIDFGRGIDLELYPPGQTFVSDWETDERDCVEMREGRAWTYQTDYSGLASVCYCMLYGKYITTEVDASGRQKISTPLKRYWQTELWTTLFDMLLNPTLIREGELPITPELADLRVKFEDWLEENCQKSGKSLRSMLKKIELQAITSRRV